MQKITIAKARKLSNMSEEAYKELRTNLQFCGKDVKVIGLTSCIPNEGKTSIALNLSMQLAEADKKVLFIDADMRKSVTVGRYRIMGASYGLSHLLSGAKELDEVMYSTNYEGLHIITAGQVPPNPSELLGDEVFTEAINQLREEFDYIIIDTPPIGSVTDAAVVSQNCDGMVLVIAQNHISYKFAQDVKGRLEKAKARILGVILNKVQKNHANGYYGSYYGRYYGRYYGKYSKYYTE
ncbi:MAG: CpsD/CapB family tyrosine-protein kinase [Eubacterium sp.]|nr:CpsD/CapB family tyrosine-protein kinase [Eubacterium sp.]